MRNFLCALVVALCAGSSNANAESFLSRLLDVGNDLGDHGEFILDESLNTSRELFMQGEQMDRAIATEVILIQSAIQDQSHQLSTLPADEVDAFIASGEKVIVARIKRLNAMVRLQMAMRPSLQLDERIVRAIRSLNNVRAAIDSEVPVAPDVWPRVAPADDIFTDQPTVAALGDPLSRQLDALQAQTSAQQSQIEAILSFAARAGVQIPSAAPPAPAQKPKALSGPEQRARQNSLRQPGGVR